MKLLASALFIGFTLLNAQILEVSQVFNIKFTKVKKEQIGTLKSFYGQLFLNETKIYDINTRFDGFITNLYANEKYKLIKKGETLFTIYSDEINSIQQELKIAKKFNKSLVESNFEKLKTFNLSNKIINKIRTSNKILNDIPFYSFNNLIVLQKNINQGSFVKKGNLILQVASLDELWFIASVYQEDLSFIKKGMKAKIYIDGINKVLDTTVDTIYPNVNTKTKAIDVKFIVNNKDLKLYPNMFGKVSIKEKAKEILTLPKTAVLKKGNKFYVFEYLSKEEFEPIEIKAKRISSYKYEILEGLNEGQQVINNALFLLDSDAITNGLYSSDDDDW